MKKIKKSLILSQIIMLFLIISLQPKFVDGAMVSKAECVMEAESGRILSTFNEHQKLPNASTTKILTAITVIDNFDINKEVVVPKSAVGIEGSSIYLREGEHLTVKELLYGLMLRSGNDCAVCLASTLCDYNEFISLMNKKAKEVGAINSNFVNPHGLHDENHYTTAYDLCKISAYAIKNKTFKEIVSTKKVTISNEGYDYKRVLINKNKLLNTLEGCDGIKTGYTKKAGRCLVTSCNKNNMEIVSVVISSPEMWERSTELIKNAQNEYKMYSLIDKDEFNDKIYQRNDGKIALLSVNKSFSYPLKVSELSNVKFKINGDSIENFINNDLESGIFEIFISNELIFSQNIFKILSNKN